MIADEPAMATQSPGSPGEQGGQHELGDDQRAEPERDQRHQAPTRATAMTTTAKTAANQKREALRSVVR